MSTSAIRAALEAIQLLGEATISGVAVTRSSLTGYRVGDVTHDLDTATRVLDGWLPLRGPVWVLGRWTETWIDGNGARRRVAALRRALGAHNVSQECKGAKSFTIACPPKLCIKITPPMGKAIPPVELPSRDRRAA